MNLLGAHDGGAAPIAVLAELAKSKIKFINTTSCYL
jgi:hypothetical protein